MWNYNNGDLEKETTGGTYLEKSGCYIANIEKFELSKSSGGCDQATITFGIDGAKTTVFHIFGDKNGKNLDWKVRHLNHMLYLLKLTNIKDPSLLKDKEIGVFLKAKLSQDKKYINFDLEGFFHPIQRKTAKELSQKENNLEVERMEDKYSKENHLVKENNYNGGSNHEQQNIEKYNGGNTESNDEFPF